MHSNQEGWIKTNCHQHPNPPEGVEVLVIVDDCVVTCKWKAYLLPLKNPKRKGRFLTLCGHRLKQSNYVDKWKIKPNCGIARNYTTPDLVEEVYSTPRWYS